MEMRKFLWIFLSVIKVTSCENILFFWAVSGASHIITVWPLIEKLAEKGHNVSILSPLPSKTRNPKVNEIIVENLMQDSGLGTLNFLEARINGGTGAISKIWGRYFDFAIKSCESLVNNPKIVNWINSSRYDLIIINAMFNDCSYGLVWKYKAPFIIFGTTAPFGWFSETYSYFDEGYPEFVHHYPLEMTFLQSVHNALMPIYWQFNRHYYMFPKVEAVLRNGLNLPDLPEVREIEKNASLVFINTHPMEEFPRSLPTNFISVGGMHCTDNTKPLSNELEQFVSSRKDGFIYLSFGTFAELKSLPINTITSIFYAMGNTTNISFIVRWTEKLTFELPTNIMIVRWINQQDVLAHSKIKAMISHAGLGGTQECVFHGVPMIALPLFAEQDINAARISSRKRGIALDIGELTQPKLQNAIEEILTNNIYATNAKQVSKLFKDRPMSAIDTAVYWVEYVLRHPNETNHLKPIGLHRNFFQKRQLDIWGFLGFIFFSVIFTVVMLSKLVFTRVFLTNLQNKKKTQ